MNWFLREATRITSLQELAIHDFGTDADDKASTYALLRSALRTIPSLRVLEIKPNSGVHEFLRPIDRCFTQVSFFVVIFLLVEGTNGRAGKL